MFSNKEMEHSSQIWYNENLLYFSFDRVWSNLFKIPTIRLFEKLEKNVKLIECIFPSYVALVEVRILLVEKVYKNSTLVRPLEKQAHDPLAPLEANEPPCISN